MRYLRRPLEYLITWLGLFYFAVLLLAGGFCLWLLTLITPAEQQRAVTQAGIARIFRIFLKTMTSLGLLKLDLSALASLKKQGPLIVAPNHPSLIDAVLLLSNMPKAVCLMKPALLANPLYGFGARAAGYISADKAIPMVRAVREAAAREEQLLFFPEGTRSVVDPVNATSSAFALVARHCSMPIQLVYIETNSKFLGKHWPLWQAPQLPVSYRTVLGPRIDPDQDAAVLQNEVEQYYRQHFRYA